MAIEPWRIWSHTFLESCRNIAWSVQQYFNCVSVSDAGNQVIAQVSGQRRSRRREEANVFE